MRLRHIVRTCIEPLAGATFSALWLVAEAGRAPSIPVVLLAGAAIGLSRILPRTALIIALGAVVAGAVAGLLPPLTPYVHGVTATDWPMYAGLFVVPALVIANGTRAAMRSSLAAAVLLPLGLIALQLQGGLPVTPESAVLLLIGSLLLWMLGWLIAGVVAFLASVLRDPLIRARFNDALKLGPSIESVPRLTARERDVLLLVSDGKSNAEIAAALFLSEATVKSHLRSILSKLSLKSRTEIVAYAWKTGLVQLA
jgi:DNA-binding CsgD family transcriptional regulator